MDDTISRQVAIDAVLSIGHITKLTDGDAVVRMSAVNYVLRNLPPAQPEITHCAGCIHWKHSAARKSYCEVFDWMSKAEDFCSFAERRDDE